MYDYVLLVISYGKLSAKFVLGTSTIIEKMGLLSHFLFLAQTTIRIRLNTSCTSIFAFSIAFSMFPFSFVIFLNMFIRWLMQLICYFNALKP